MGSQSRCLGCISSFLCAFMLAFTNNALAQSVDEIYAQGQEANEQADMAGAMNYFRQAAELGHAASQAELARLLDAAEFNTEAFQWYQRAADQGNIQGQLGLATMLVAGETGDADMEAGFHWFSTAAENGSLHAMRVLESNYRTGGMGLKADAGKADYWLNRAALEGDPRSQEKLAQRKANATEN